VKKILLAVVLIICLPLFYVAVVLIWGTIFDFQPESRIDLEVVDTSDRGIIQDSTLSFMTWNIGYGGLGAQSNFFFDNGGFFVAGDKTVTETEQRVDYYLDGIFKFIADNKVDFWMLQEVDRESKRSHDINQYQGIQNMLPGYSANYAINFQNGRVPIPLMQPWKVIGHVDAGVASFSKYTPSDAVRCQLPGEYPWPDRIFHLDRCALMQRYNVQGGKQLVVVNTHNSAFDKGGVLKTQQLKHLNELLTEEYKKGNYVVAGGDWNQGPNLQSNTFSIIEGYQQKVPRAIPPTFLEGWSCVSNYSVPTNRELKNTFDKTQSKVQIIDFFYISPNLRVKEIKGIDMEFEFSDHQPVYMEIEFVDETLAQLSE
jgi:endonuclease/exonuclease/phosphatase family metal-dependent hydrolase